MNTYVKFTDDNSDSLTHYGVKGMKWRRRKGSINELMDSGVADYKQKADDTSNFKKLRSSTRVGAKNVVRSLKKAGSKSINGVSGAILKGKRNRQIRKLHKKKINRSMAKSVLKIRDQGVREQTARSKVKDTTYGIKQKMKKKRKRGYYGGIY